MVERGKRLARRVTALAEEWDVPPSHVAFAFAFRHPALASLLFGASTPEQLHENVDAWATFQRMDDDQLAEIGRLGDNEDA